MNTLNRKRYFLLFPLFFIFLVTTFVFYQGLDSRFLLDDHINLADLGLVKKNGYGYYIFGGVTGNVGRPLSLMTFALQYESWAANPAAIKTVNLALHLVNGILVFFLALFVTRRMQQATPKAEIYSLFITAFWLLNPIQLSTVLYTVQRMNMLSTFFILSGILGYLKYREIYTSRNDFWKGFTGMSLAVGLGGVLGILSKENAILLPLFILLTEYVIRPGIFKDKRWRPWAMLFLALPLLMLLVYFVLKFGQTVASYEKRDYSMVERLLTQPIILFDYFTKIIIPQVGSYSLFYDDIEVSKGLLKPPATIICMGGLIVTVLASFKLRRSCPMIAFGLLWFLAGHTLESSHLSLELYFEHRNYLPLFGIGFFLVGVAEVAASHVDRKIIYLFGAIYLAFMTTIAYLESDLWSRPVIQAAEWARKHPRSDRALENLANSYIGLRQLENAKETYNRISQMNPGVIYPDIQNMIIRHCMEEDDFTNDEWQDIYNKATVAKVEGLSALVKLDFLVKELQDDRCTHMNIKKLSKLIIILVNNPEFAKHRPVLHELATILSIEYGDPRAALANVDAAIGHGRNANLFILKFKILMALNQKYAARKVLDELEEYLDERPMERITYQTQVDELTNRLSSIE